MILKTLQSNLEKKLVLGQSTNNDIQKSTLPKSGPSLALRILPESVWLKTF